MALAPIYVNIHDGEWRSMNKCAECHHRRGAPCDYICLLWRQHTNPSAIEKIRIENAITCQIGSRMTAWFMKSSRQFPKFRNFREAYNDLVAHEQPDKVTRKSVADFLLRRWRNDLEPYEADNGAIRFVEASKISFQHWATWIPPQLSSRTPKQQQKELPSSQKFVPWSYDPPVREEWSPQPRCRFLALPAELRLEILGHALAPDHNSTNGFGKDLHRGRIVGTVASWVPCIARTCRQLWSEAVPLFYDQNVFIFYLDSWFSLEKSKRWVRARRNRYIGQLRNIIILGFNASHPANSIHGHVLHATGQISFFGSPAKRLHPVRIGIDLKNFTFAVDIDTSDKEVEEWRLKTAHIIDELKQATNGFAVSESQLCRLLEIFGQDFDEVEDARPGRKVFAEGRQRAWD